jgi:parallel beta-helix repeat protein
MWSKKFSGIMLALLLVGILAFSIQPAEASVTMYEAIYIRADGTIEPEGAPISTTDYITYILTDDIVSRVMDYGIVVEREDIILDGQNHTLEGVKRLDSKGVYLYYIKNVTIENVNIKLFFYGIYLDTSSNNTISGNNITYHRNSGVFLASGCINNTISGNNITNNGDGIAFENYCNNNNITENNIINNLNGISLIDCFDNRVIGNDIINNNGSGIYIYRGSNNIIHHNNFINNVNQTSVAGASINVWDDGAYGNYWSNYKGWDGVWILGFVFGRDGIGDQPYVINADNKDRFPVTTNYPPPDMGQIAAVIILVIAIVVVAVFVKRIRKRKKA